MRVALAVLLSSAFAAVPTANAADDSNLEQQVKALTEAVHVLQQRVDRLEGSSAAATPTAATTPAPHGAGYVSSEAEIRMNWAKIKPDMAQADVVRLLGAPSKKFTLNGRNVWYYYYPATGNGSVFFTDAGRVSSRQSPFGLGW